ncbi:MAG: family 20 glycosylhydrolase [Bacteroidales bacterium]|nr:family 20 glycosylhydrolase [Candidatus Physcousia equi]
MKKRLLLLLACVLSLAAQVKADDIPFRQQRREMFSICPTDPQTVVFLGNSITNFGVWPEVFANSGYKVVNRGISGNFSPEVMQHIRLIADGQPKAIYLMIGINDYGTPDVIVPSIKKTIQIVREVSPSTDIYVQSILPCAYNPRQTTPTTQNPLIKAMIETDFAGDAKVHYANIFDALSTDGSTPKAGVLDDNLHPNVNGYRDWTKKLHEAGYIDVAPKYSDEAWTNAGGLHYYDNRILGQYNKLPIASTDIFIMGDRTVQGGEWAELMQNQSVKNRGIGIGTGQLTTSLAKFKTEIPYILHGTTMPSKIAVQVGQCDLILNGATADNSWTTYTQCIDLIHQKAPNAQIYLNTVIPVVAGDGKAANNAQVVAFNEKIRSYANSTNYCTLVDIADKLDDANGYLAAEFEGANSKQSKVPNGRAYLEWAKLLTSTMGLSSTPRETMTAKQYELLLKIDDTYAKAYSQNVGNQVGNVSNAAFTTLMSSVDAAKALLKSTDEAAIDAQISGLGTALTTMNSNVVMTPQLKDDQNNDQYYRLKSQRGSRYVTAEGNNGNILGTTAVGDGSYWKFVSRTDGNYDLVNYLTKTYISADGVSSGNALQSSTTSPSKGWRIDSSNEGGYMTVVGDGIQFNQQKNGNFYVLNWGDGTTKTDDGCKYVVETIAFEDLPALGETQTLTYVLTDAAGNEYRMTADGTPGTDPVITGATLSGGSWAGNTYTATVTFPFAVSKKGGTSSYVGISAFNGTAFYYYAKDGGVYVKQNNQPNDYTYAWCIYPSLDSTGKFRFTIKNVETNTYIQSTSSDNSHNAGAVTLAAQGTAMTFENGGFLLPTGKYLSVNSSAQSAEQVVGTWGSHGGTAVKVTNLSLTPKEPEKPIEGAVAYDLNLEHENLGHLLPQPRSVNLTGSALNLTGGIHIIYNKELSEDEAYLQKVMDRFLSETGCTAGNGITLKVDFVTAITGTEDYKVEKFDNEAYAIKVDGNTITVSAIKPIGVVRAMQTLTMMAKENSTLPGCEIVDWPAFKVRGLMHDIGRSYISVKELKEEIDLLSRFKENVFLWHLTDKHGFRFESKKHPKVNTNFSPTRSDKFYTQAECLEVAEYAHERGITILPEIDMPGHSARFEGATGVTMASEAGRAILKDILVEVAAAFPYSPYIHIGGDETNDATIAYINEMADYIHNTVGRKVVVWNQFGGNANRQSVNPSTLRVDMSTNWATSGRLSAGIPNIDMRYNYLNHFDMYGDLAGIYRSKIFNVTKGNPDVAGSISGIWNDRLIPEEELIVKENNVYANALATCERGWKGGGLHYTDDAEGGAYLPNSGSEYEEFKDWETRFLFHKNTTLSAAKSKIPYVKQTNVRWNITKAYDNGGDQNKVFAPETATELVPESGSITATGAGIWLNHIWAGTVAGVLGKAGQPTGQTRYAWTYVYSPKAQTVGAQVETYNYSRSQMGAAPANGTWDNRGSRIWVNETELKPNVNWTTAGSGEETNLGNINFTARPLMQVQLKEGWNKVLLKLPNTKANIGNYGGKWQYTFVFTKLDGSDAAEGLVYSPTKCIDEEAEALSVLIQEVRNYIDNNCSGKVGSYPATLSTNTTTLCNDVAATLSQEMTDAQRADQKKSLQSALDALKAAVANAPLSDIVLPVSFTEENPVYYTMRDKRGNKYATSNGAGVNMTGIATASPQSMWSFTKRTDGTYDLQNFSDGTYLAPINAYNTSLKSTTAKPANGWTVKPIAAGQFILYTTLGSQRNQLHQTTNTALYNWGWEANADPKTTDMGCVYSIQEVTDDMLPNRVSITYVVDGVTTFADNNYRLGELNITAGNTVVAVPEVSDNGQTKTYTVNPGETLTVTEKQRYHGWNTPTIEQNGDKKFTVTYTPNLKEESQYLWYTTKNNHPYRIPAIAKMSNGEILAVMDYRTCNDDIGMGEVDLVGRIGTADGKSWTKEFMIADGDGNASTYPYFGCGFGDAAVVADRESGKVVIMCVSGKVRYTNANASTHPCVARVVSEDYGRTWKIENVTDQFLGKSTSLLPGSYALFFGSGRIVQSKQVKVDGSSYYRLYASIVSRGDSNSNGNFVVYSDNFGETWQFLGGAKTCAPNGNEPKVEELPNGDIMLSSRKSGGRYFNVFNFSNFASNKTAGTWGSQTNSTGITAADCNGEIIVLDAYKTYDGKKTKVLLQSVPCNGSRRDVGFYYKEIDPATKYTASTIATGWTKGMAVSNLESAYSTMVEQQDGRLAFLFEEAPTFNNTFGYAEVYRPISIYEATAGAFQMEEVKEPTKDAYVKYFNTEQARAEGKLSWVGIRNVRNSDYTCHVANASASSVGSHNVVSNPDAELFAFVGTPESFYIYSKTYGTENGKALGYTSSSAGGAVTPGKNSLFTLVKHQTSEGTFLICPKTNTDQSWNMYQGVGNDIKFWDSTDAGSNWRLDLVYLYGEETGINSIQDDRSKVTKMLQKGAVVIRKGNTTYDLTGRRIK